MAVRGFDVGGMFQRSGGRIGANIGAGAAAMGKGLEGLLTGVRTGLNERGERLDAENVSEQYRQILDTYQTNPAGMIQQAQLLLARPDENSQRFGKLLMEQADRLTEANALKIQQDSDQKLRDSIVASATSLGLTDIAERAANTTDSEALRAIQKDLREQEIKNVVRERGTPGRKALARRYGIDYEEYMSGLSDDNFMKVLEGKEAELKSFILPDGKEVLLAVDKQGKVRDPKDGVFKRASDMELRRAPNRQQVETIANYQNQLMAEVGIQHFLTLHEETSQTIQTLNNIEEVLPLTDEMITGATAQPELFVRRIKSEMSEFLGIDSDDPALQNTEAYIALAAPRVAEIIKNFGAGTGLSDADREFANKAAAGDIAMTAASLQRILKILKKAGENKVALYNKTVKEMGTTPGSYGFVLPSRTKRTPPTNQDSESVAAPPSGFERDQ